eukprot:gene60-81_t
MTSSTSKDSKQQQQVFGVDLETLINSQNESIDPKGIPRVVAETIAWLEKNNAGSEEGIFRIPGKGQTIQEIKKAYNEGQSDILSKFSSPDIHTVAGVLKLYLRELPEPLFIWRYYSTFIKVVRNQESLQRVLHLRMLVYGLPKVNRDLVLYLMSFLNRISQQSDVNKMTTTNLAMVFAPNILRHEKESLNQIMEDSSHVMTVIKLLIEEISYISKITHHLSASVNDIPLPTIPGKPEEQPLSASGGMVVTPLQLENNTLYARALYPYQTSGQWHLPFRKSDQITLLDIKSEEGWMKGELNGRVGYFPASYVEIVPSPLSTSPFTLVPIPDLDTAQDLTTIITTTTTTQQTTTTTTTTTTVIKTAAGGSASPLTNSGEMPVPISASKSTSSGKLKNGPPLPPRSFAQASPPLGSTAGGTIATTPPLPINRSHGSSSSLTNSPDLAKVITTAPPATTGNKPTQNSGGSSTSISTPPPPLVAPPSLSSSGSSFMSGSPDFGKVMSTTPKLSFSSSLPPSLSLPPTLLPSQRLALSHSGPTSHTPSSPAGTPPVLSSSAANVPPSHHGKSGSFLDFSLVPPPPLSLPSPISTPHKVPPPIDPSNLPPPPFSPCSPEPATFTSSSPFSKTREIPPPPVFDIPLPPPPPPVDSDDEYALPNINYAPAVVPPGTIPKPPPPPPKRLDRAMSYIGQKHINEEKLAEIRKKRRERAEEMLSTERTYVKQLTVILEHFIEPSKARAKLFSLSEEVLNTFSCLEVILNAHRTNILKALEARMLEWDAKPQLGDIFINNTSFIKLYKHYVNNYDRSIVGLKQCKERNTDFRNFVASLDYSERFSGLNVESFLILPVQRIPRYVLLLQDLLKYTNNDHEDFNQLVDALGTIKDFAETINFKKSEEDNAMKIASIQHTIRAMPPNTLERRKRFICEGALSTKKDKFYVFLFSDALILTKPGKEKKKFKTLINLQTASLNTTDEAGVFKIISQEGIFKFQAQDTKERDFWTKSLKEAIEAARQEMIQSAFGDQVLTNEGSKGFNRIQDEKNAQKKHKLAEELSTSEGEYVLSLTYIQNIFLAPIRKSLDTANPLVSYSEGLDICSNFETLLSCHTVFAGVLKERLQQWDAKPTLSDLFLEKGAFLKLYNYYVQHHTSSLQTIESCIEKYPLFAIHLRNIESNEKAELKHLLAEPLRRIARYYLILQEVLQYTRPKQDDHEALSKVVSNLKEQNDKFNIASLFTASTELGSRSPHKSKTMRVKQPKGLSKDSKLSTSGYFV